MEVWDSAREADRSCVPADSAEQEGVSARASAQFAAEQVVVPAAVLAEISAKGQDDPTLRRHLFCRLAHRRTGRRDSRPGRGMWTRPGRDSVLRWPSATPTAKSSWTIWRPVVPRPRWASRVSGQLGLVLLGKWHGVIPAAHPTIEELRRVGLYLGTTSSRTSSSAWENKSARAPIETSARHENERRHVVWDFLQARHISQTSQIKCVATFLRTPAYAIFHRDIRQARN